MQQQLGRNKQSSSASAPRSTTSPLPNITLNLCHTFRCQVPPTVDNILESVVACTAAALGLGSHQLLNTHRLDAGTSGVVVLARSPQAASAFTKLLQDKQQHVVKVRALLHLMMCHSKKCHRPRTSSCHKNSKVEQKVRASGSLLVLLALLQLREHAAIHWVEVSQLLSPAAHH